MRTETKLALNVIIPLMVSMAVIAVVFMVLQHLDREAARGRTYQEIENKIHALHVTATRVQIRSDATAIHQIKALSVSLDALLQGMTFTDAREEYFVRQIRKNAQDLATSLQKLITSALDPSVSTEMRAERHAVFVSQLWMKTQFISDDTQQLIGISRARVADARRQALALALILVFALLASNAAISYFTGRNLLRTQEGLRQALAEAEKGDRLLSALMEHVPEGITIADKALKVMRISRYGQSLRGAAYAPRSIEEATAQWEVFQTDGQTPLPFEQLPLVRAIRHGEVIKDVEIVRLNARGESLPLLCSAGPIRDGAGDIIGGIVTWRDITARKQAEEQLRQARKMESIGRLAGGVAHDFNNKLSIILGNAELALAGGELPPSARHFLKEIQQAAQLSADLTSQLLSFARKQMIVPQVLDLNEAVEGMLNMLRRLIGEQIQLIWLPGMNIWPVHMDPSQVDQILTNLCANARDAIEGVGTVTIKTGNATVDAENSCPPEGAIPGDYVVLTVSDNGCGMTEQTKNLLFEPFFTTKGVNKGTGMGLPMIYGIIKQNRGHIDVASEPGKGATFTIYLPRHGSKKAQPPKEEPNASIPGGHETLLVVEDEPSLLTLDQRMLEKLGYRVLAATMPGEALRLAAAQAGTIDLLITDVIMPEMNGRELAQRLRSIYPHIGVVFISGYTANVIAHHGVLAPGVHFLHKPFMIKALAAKVREALDSCRR
ncbi:MAG: response regulator [Desulfobacterales bacterium]|nr:response regulator [Desulfobacterales bacterium]